jgi:hypothetical protein
MHGWSEEMKERFEGGGRQNLVDSLVRQELVSGNADLAAQLAKSGEVVEFSKGDKLITEGAEDNSIYMLLSGSAAIVIKCCRSQSGSACRRDGRNRTGTKESRHGRGTRYGSRTAGL